MIKKSEKNQRNYTLKSILSLHPNCIKKKHLSLSYLNILPCNVIYAIAKNLAYTELSILNRANGLIPDFKVGHLLQKCQYNPISDSLELSENTYLSHHCLKSDINTCINNAINDFSMWEEKKSLEKIVHKNWHYLGALAVEKMNSDVLANSSLQNIINLINNTKKHYPSKYKAIFAAITLSINIPRNTSQDEIFTLINILFQNKIVINIEEQSFSVVLHHLDFHDTHSEEIKNKKQQLLYEFISCVVRIKDINIPIHLNTSFYSILLESLLENNIKPTVSLSNIEPLILNSSAEKHEDIAKLLVNMEEIVAPINIGKVNMQAFVKSMIKHKVKPCNLYGIEYILQNLADKPELIMQFSANLSNLEEFELPMYLDSRSYTTIVQGMIDNGININILNSEYIFYNCQPLIYEAMALFCRTSDIHIPLFLSPNAFKDIARGAILHQIKPSHWICVDNLILSLGEQNEFNLISQFAQCMVNCDTIYFPCAIKEEAKIAFCKGLIKHKVKPKIIENLNDFFAFLNRNPSLAKSAAQMFALMQTLDIQYITNPQVCAQFFLGLIECKVRPSKIVNAQNFLFTLEQSTTAQQIIKDSMQIFSQANEINTIPFYLKVETYKSIAQGMIKYGIKANKIDGLDNIIVNICDDKQLLEDFIAKLGSISNFTVPVCLKPEHSSTIMLSMLDNNIKLNVSGYNSEFSNLSVALNNLLALPSKELQHKFIKNIIAPAINNNEVSIPRNLDPDIYIHLAKSMIEGHVEPKIMQFGEYILHASQDDQKLIYDFMNLFQNLEYAVIPHGLRKESYVTIVKSLYENKIHANIFFNLEYMLSCFTEQESSIIYNFAQVFKKNNQMAENAAIDFILPANMNKKLMQNFIRGLVDYDIKPQKTDPFYLENIDEYLDESLAFSCTKTLANNVQSLIIPKGLDTKIYHQLLKGMIHNEIKPLGFANLQPLIYSLTPDLLVECGQIFTKCKQLNVPNFLPASYYSHLIQGFIKYNVQPQEIHGLYNILRNINYNLATNIGKIFNNVTQINFPENLEPYMYECFIGSLIDNGIKLSQLDNLEYVLPHLSDNLMYHFPNLLKDGAYIEMVPNLRPNAYQSFANGLIEKNIHVYMRFNDYMTRSLPANIMSMLLNNNHIVIA